MSLARPFFSSSISLRSAPRSLQCSLLRATCHQQSSYPRIHGSRRSYANTTQARKFRRNHDHNFGLRCPQHLNSIRIRRSFGTTPVVSHGHIDPPKPGEERHVTFIDKEGEEHNFEVSDGSNLLDIAQANDLEMEGACGGSCACSTCHVIVEDQDMYDRMEEPSDDENDMLDLAFGLTETSRLGCQIQMSKDLDGLRVKLPSMTRNLQASDFAKKE
ncbi:ferredoxin [Viridothelium virens]|uniref:Ferredoxin n=1 Tax=Viridothelium virens TaxID=1048519 RepID=A0A6A6H2Z5_VIRVR|nr:ferredoxin [Viridothelium virens]